MIKTSKLPSELDKLFDECDGALKANGLPTLPLRREILTIRNIRNGAQHDARDPNLNEVNDCRTYSRDFCQQVINNIWNISFTDLSLIDIVIDPLIQKLLSGSVKAINNGDIKKGLTYIDFVFYVAKLCFLPVLPKKSYHLNQSQIPEIGNQSASYLSSYFDVVEESANLFAALLANGVNIIDYTKLINNIPRTYFNYSSSIQTPSKHELVIHVQWQGINPDIETAIWVIYFVTDLIIQWQLMGLNPGCNTDDQKEQATTLLTWDVGNQIRIF